MADPFASSSLRNLNSRRYIASSPSVYAYHRYYIPYNSFNMATPKKSGDGSGSANNASILLEKGNPSGRRATPDSEAMTSSDDEKPAAPQPKPMRRTSWLNEVPQTMPRKASLTTTCGLSSSGSNPATPATDQAGWGSSTSPALSSSIAWSGSNLTWGTGIWNTDSRKDPPPRLMELSQSPTSPNPPGSTEELLSPTARSVTGESSIPFSIPLHPTPKTYRSQSYSAGQLDPETMKLMSARTSYNPSRTRNGTSFSTLQQRSSRPSLLGDLGHDPALLQRVREDDDGEHGDVAGARPDVDGGLSQSPSQARTIEQLTRENALLRQQAAFRDRAVSTASANSGYSVAGGVPGLHRIRGRVPEEDLAVEDQDELGEIPPGYANLHASGRRRFSEHSVNLEKQLSPFASLDNRPLDSIRRAHWQTSLGFGSISELPQSRRHSFAEIPLRQSSIGSIGEPQPCLGSIGSRPGPGGEWEEYESGEKQTSFFPGRDAPLHSAADAPTPTSVHQAYNMPSFSRQPGLVQPHHNQLLYIVTFKCQRADVFYIQEGTGLQVKESDLVIVEADRGTDLGTIQHANVTWEEARQLKEYYAEEHYKALMMFSRQGQNAAAALTAGRGAVGSGHGSHDPGDLKPKLIKRVAQQHEVLALRDKEGNEAKAKRVCQQKVAEHRLNMEILDAEFQMDWKKLTFYYFADTYINFNALVTDLFKIYKTRIWMSAINPASFASPSAGLTPGGYGQDHSAERRHQGDRRGHGNIHTMPSREALEPRDTGGLGLARNTYVDPYHAYGRQPDVGYANSLPNDPFASFPTNYGALDGGVSDYNMGAFGGAGTGRINNNPTQGDWVSRFQGLSLGS